MLSLSLQLTFTCIHGNLRKINPVTPAPKKNIFWNFIKENRKGWTWSFFILFHYLFNKQPVFHRDSMANLVVVSSLHNGRIVILHFILYPKNLKKNSLYILFERKHNQDIYHTLYYWVHLFFISHFQSTMGKTDCCIGIEVPRESQSASCETSPGFCPHRTHFLIGVRT